MSTSSQPRPNIFKPFRTFLYDETMSGWCNVATWRLQSLRFHPELRGYFHVFSWRCLFALNSLVFFHFAMQEDGFATCCVLQDVFPSHSQRSGSTMTMVRIKCLLKTTNIAMLTDIIYDIVGAWWLTRLTLPSGLGVYFTQYRFIFFLIFFLNTQWGK